MNTKLHAVTNQNGRPLSFFMTGGGSQHAMTDAPPSSSQPSASPEHSSSGYES
ncbi:hypothetical protein B932_1118 [Gluconobacter oxydans H24]|nr:hypothetical protein B932_1118 [Gluconobacter oxydans H24]